MIEVFLDDTMAASVLPERFSSGDFGTWLRHFNRCAAANGWSDGDRLSKLPAFLQGPAATYFDSLTGEEKESIAALSSSLSQCFTPVVERERFYREFESQNLRPNEDPSLFI